MDFGVDKKNNILLKDFSSYANQVTNDLVSYVENMTASLKRPLIYLPSAKNSKEQTALAVLKDKPVEEGLICTLSVVEYCQTLQPVKKKTGLLELSTVNRKCKYYYFYYLDKKFGFMHVKLQTWFPFQIQVYINGRELMKHVFDEHGITYKMYDNSFFEISDISKAQELADQFDSKSLFRQLDFFAHKVNPYLDTVETILHTGYHWCVDQCSTQPMSCLRAEKLFRIFIRPWLATHFTILNVPIFFPFWDVNLMPSFWESQSPITVNARKAGGLNSK